MSAFCQKTEKIGIHALRAQGIGGIGESDPELDTGGGGQPRQNICAVRLAARSGAGTLDVG